MQTLTAADEFWILHLSDFHFGPTSHWGRFPDEARRFAEEIKGAIHAKGMVPMFDAVVCTGDFTFSRNNYLAGFPVAEEFVRELIRQDFVSDVEQVVLTPGNHDIRWAAPGSGYRYRSREEAERSFRNMLRNTYGNGARADSLTLAQSHVFPKNGINYVILGLNSARVEAAEVAGIGYVGEDQLGLPVRRRHAADHPKSGS
jgi:hypothetical protein